MEDYENKPKIKASLQRFRAKYLLPTLGIKFDLKAPCADCPFKKSTKKHEGVASSLTTYYEQVESGNFIHTCHKTDPRSDSPEGQKYEGPLQHCAGLMAMARTDKSIKSFILREAERLKLLPRRRKANPEVYSTFNEMVQDYADWIKNHQVIVRFRTRKT